MSYYNYNNGQTNTPQSPINPYGYKPSVPQPQGNPYPMISNPQQHIASGYQAPSGQYISRITNNQSPYQPLTSQNNSILTPTQNSQTYLAVECNMTYSEAVSYLNSLSSLNAVQSMLPKLYATSVKKAQENIINQISYLNEMANKVKSCHFVISNFEKNQTFLDKMASAIKNDNVALKTTADQVLDNVNALITSAVKTPEYKLLDSVKNLNDLTIKAKSNKITIESKIKESNRLSGVVNYSNDISNIKKGLSDFFGMQKTPSIDPNKLALENITREIEVLKIEQTHLILEIEKLKERCTKLENAILNVIQSTPLIKIKSYGEITNPVPVWHKNTINEDAFEPRNPMADDLIASDLAKINQLVTADWGANYSDQELDGMKWKVYRTTNFWYYKNLNGKSHDRVLSIITNNFYDYVTRKPVNISSISTPLIEKYWKKDLKSYLGKNFQVHTLVDDKGIESKKGLKFITNTTTKEEYLVDKNGTNYTPLKINNDAVASKTWIPIPPHETRFTYLDGKLQLASEISKNFSNWVILPDLIYMNSDNRILRTRDGSQIVIVDLKTGKNSELKIDGDKKSNCTHKREVLNPPLFYVYNGQIS